MEISSGFIQSDTSKHCKGNNIISYYFRTEYEMRHPFYIFYVIHICYSVSNAFWFRNISKFWEIRVIVTFSNNKLNWLSSFQTNFTLQCSIPYFYTENLAFDTGRPIIYYLKCNVQKDISFHICFQTNEIWYNFVL